MRLGRNKFNVMTYFSACLSHDAIDCIIIIMADNDNKWLAEIGDNEASLNARICP